MPDEVIRYKIQIDDSDIADQISNVRKQVDDAIASSFSSSSALNASTSMLAGQASLSVPRFDGAQFGLLNQDSLSAPSVDISTTRPNIPISMSPMPTGPISFNEVGSTLSDFTSNFYQNANAGFNMFTGQSNAFLANAQAGLGMFRNDIASMGPGEGLAAAFGFGYDRSMIPMSRTEFTELANMRLNVGDHVTEALPGIAGGIIGGAIGGAVGGIPGALLGSFAGDKIFGAMGDFVTSDYTNMRQLSQGLGQMAEMSMGGLTGGQLDAISRNILNQTSSYDFMARGQSIGEITSTLTNFASTGGFSGTSDAAGFEAKVQAVINNAEIVARSLGTFMDQAAQIMGSLENKGIAQVQNMPSFMGQLGAMAQAGGLTSMELMQFGLGSADALRGTGLGAGASFDMGIDARVVAGRMAHSGSDYLKQAVYEMGGEESAAQQIMQSTAAFGMGPWGKIMTGARQGGFSGYGLEGNVGAYADWLGSDPTNFLSQGANQGRWAAGISSEQNAVAMSRFAVDALDMMTGDSSRKYNFSAVQDMMTQIYGTEGFAAAAKLYEGLNGAQLGNYQGQAYLNVLEGVTEKYHYNKWDEAKAGINSAINNVLSPFAGGSTDAIGSISKAITGVWNSITDWWGGTSRLSADDYTITSQGTIDLLKGGDNAIFGLDDLKKRYRSGGSLTKEDALVSMNRWDFSKGQYDALGSDYANLFVRAAGGASNKSAHAIYDFVVNSKNKGLSADALSKDIELSLQLDDDMHSTDLSGKEYSAASSAIYQKIQSGGFASLRLDSKRSFSENFESAAQSMFGKSVSELDSNERAALSTVIQTTPGLSKTAGAPPYAGFESGVEGTKASMLSSWRSQLTDKGGLIDKAYDSAHSYLWDKVAHDPNANFGDAALQFADKQLWEIRDLMKDDASDPKKAKFDINTKLANARAELQKAVEANDEQGIKNWGATVSMLQNFSVAGSGEKGAFTTLNRLNAGDIESEVDKFVQEKFSGLEGKNIDQSQINQMKDAYRGQVMTNLLANKDTVTAILGSDDKALSELKSSLIKAGGKDGNLLSQTELLEQRAYLMTRVERDELAQKNPALASRLDGMTLQHPERIALESMRALQSLASTVKNGEVQVNVK